MPIYAIPPLISSLLFISLGIFVLKQSRATQASKLAFFLQCLATFWWQFTWFLLFQIPDNPFVHQLIKIGYSGIILIPATFFHFFATLLYGKKYLSIIKLYYLISFVFLTLLHNSLLIINGTYFNHFGHYPKAGILHPLYLTFLITVVIHNIYILYNKQKDQQTNNQDRNQARYLLAGFSIYLIAASDFLVNYGFKFYPIGFIFISIYLCTNTFAIVKHQLMDIRIVIQKSLVYTSLFAIISITYLSIIFICESITQYFLGYQSPFFRFFIAFFLGICLLPFKTHLQGLVNTFFIHGNPCDIAVQNEYLLKEVAQKEKFKAVATLASGVAHEIKNPLTALKTFVEFLPQKKNDPEFMQRFTIIAAKEFDRMENLVKQLLDFSKPSPLNFQRTNISQLLDDVIALNSMRIKENNIKVIKHYPTVTVSIPLDQNQIKQAFINIIQNAIDAMPDGGTLTIGVRVQDSLHPTPYTLTPKIIISITDTGCGIDKEGQKQIFEPFYSQKSQGTGLGLSITYGIIQEHQGKITVNSILNKGTTFEITLPYKKT